MKPRISVTGISILKPALQDKYRQHGFTLWELLIVVAIIAITVSVTQLSIGLGDEARDLKRIGRDLDKLLHLLNQEAVFESRNFAISVHAKGFYVLEYDQGKWLQSSDSFFSKIKMTDSQSSQLIIDEHLIDTAGKESPEPHVLILSSGEMTPFEWRISDQATQSRIVLQGNVLGSVLMSGPEPLG